MSMKPKHLSKTYEERSGTYRLSQTLPTIIRTLPKMFRTLTNMFKARNFFVVLLNSAGVGRTGLFCALSVLIERLKSEAVVDVLQAVKQLRAQRPVMVQTKVSVSP